MAPSAQEVKYGSPFFLGIRHMVIFFAFPSCEFVRFEDESEEGEGLQAVKKKVSVAKSKRAKKRWCIFLGIDCFMMSFVYVVKIFGTQPKQLKVRQAQSGLIHLDSSAN